MPARLERVLVVHPSADLYGSDRTMLESVHALVESGADVVVVLCSDGPLRELVGAAGARVVSCDVPVLRKSVLMPTGLLTWVLRSVRALPGMWALLREVRPQVIYVSTITIPQWIVMARLRRARLVCHVHEAESEARRFIRIGLAAPLLLTHSVIANSRASRDLLVAEFPVLARRTRVVYNGVAGPPDVTAGRADLDPPTRLVLVGRISPRKGTDVAIDAVAVLRDRGVEVRLTIVGDAFPGYEWYVEQIRERIRQADLGSRVRMIGLRSSVWEALAEADIAVVPSRLEPFGNVAVEALLACRPVVVADVQGLREIITDGVNGSVVPRGDAAALASAVQSIIENWRQIQERTVRAEGEARERFSLARYRQEIRREVGAGPP